MSTLIRNRKVCDDNINLTGLQVTYPSEDVGGDVVDINTQISSYPLGVINIISLIFSLFIYITKGLFIGINTNIDGATLLDLIKGPENTCLLLGHHSLGR